MNENNSLDHFTNSSDRLWDAVSESDIFERQFGAELTLWELQLLRSFRERLFGRTYRYRGFVHYTRDSSLIMLTPSPWLADGVFIYFRSDQELPPEGALVEITGSRIVAPAPLQRQQDPIEAFTADSIELLPHELLSSITRPPRLKELEALLFEYVGMAEPNKGVFTRLFISSPPFEQTIGGLSTGVQALTAERQVRRLLTFFRQVLPPTFRGRWSPYREIRGVRVSTPRIWRLDVGKLQRKKLEALCIDRRDPSGFKEVSVAALTDSASSALPDIPLAMDSEDFWVETRHAADLRLPVLKAAITYQLLMPTVSPRTIESVTRYILRRLEYLRESFALTPSALAIGHILNANASGRPLSAIRLARSTARAEWKTKTTAKDVKRSWDRLLEPALKEFLEIGSLQAESEKNWGSSKKFERFNSKILRALKQLDEARAGSLGPTLEEIAAEANLAKHIIAAELEKMKLAGVVYEPRPGHFRLV